MVKKLMMVLGLGTTLALSSASACDKAKAASDKEAQKAAIHAESMADKASGSCMKKSETAKAEKSGDQSMASHGDHSKGADCPKAECDKADCQKHAKVQEKSGAKGEASTEKAPAAKTDI